MNVRACVYGFFVVILCAERDRLKNINILKYNHLERVEYLNRTQVN